MSISIGDYIPSISELDADKVLETRTWLEQFLLTGWGGEIDLRPGSPFGDLIIEPTAFMQTALEEAINRLMSDTNLENIENGTIYNEDFVTQFLDNFSVRDLQTTTSYGMVRLHFTSDDIQVLSQNLQFTSGEQSLVLNQAERGNTYLHPEGGLPHIMPNEVEYTFSGVNDYTVDLPVSAPLIEEMEKGTVLTVVGDTQNLSYAEVITDISLPGLTGSLSERASLARKTYFSPTMTSRNGCISYLTKNYPHITNFSVVVPGDSEMIREQTWLNHEFSSCMDIYTRSSNTLDRETQIIRIPYDTTTGQFIGKVYLPHVAVKIHSITSVSSPDLDLDYTLYSHTEDSKEAPLLTTAYSTKEALWFKMTMPQDSQLNNKIEVGTGYKYNQFYATFAVDYSFDPHVPVIQSELDNRDNKPIGASILVKSFVPVVIDRFSIRVARTKGTTFNEDAAREAIYDYLNNLSFPDVYIDAEISRILQENGALGVRDIDCEANLQWTVADKVIRPTHATENTILDVSDLEAVEDALRTDAGSYTVDPVKVNITNTAGFVVSFMDEQVGTLNQTLATAGDRNIMFYIEKDIIKFVDG